MARLWAPPLLTSDCLVAGARIQAAVLLHQTTSVFGEAGPLQIIAGPLDKSAFKTRNPTQLVEIQIAAMGAVQSIKYLLLKKAQLYIHSFSPRFDYCRAHLSRTGRVICASKIAPIFLRHWAS